MVYIKGGEIMNNEQIKEILITLINNGQVLTGSDNKEIAENMAVFINTLKQELKEGATLKPTMTPEEIAERVKVDVVLDIDDDSETTIY